MKMSKQTKALFLYYQDSIQAANSCHSISFDLCQGFICNVGKSLQRWLDLQMSQHPQYGLRPDDDTTQPALLFLNHLLVFGSLLKILLCILWLQICLARLLFHLLTYDPGWLYQPLQVFTMVLLFHLRRTHRNWNGSLQAQVDRILQLRARILAGFD